MDRGRKRSDPPNPLPADKRPCCPSSEPGPSSSSNPPPADCDVDSSSSGRSDPASAAAAAADDSTYASCDDSEPDYDPVHPEYDYDPGWSTPASRTKFDRILSSLDGAMDPLPALTELCEVLSFSMEDSLSNFPMEVAIPHLVRLSGDEVGPEIMLLAIRALTYLCDIVPRSADSLVRHKALPVLCARLLSVDYIDVAEQSLQALEKISKRQPVRCLQAGVIDAALTYVDFFTSAAQRVALNTVANVCKRLPVDSSSFAMKAVPALCNLLQNDDRKLVETAATCLIRITECFSQSSERLDELCMNGVIDRRLLNLVAVDGRMSLSQTTCVGLIGLLTRLATNSVLAVKTLFELHISSILRGILLACDVSRGTAYSTMQDVQSSQVHEVLKLLNQLVPPASRDTEEIQVVLAKEKILEDEPKFLHQFSADILPVAIQVASSGAHIYICYGFVSIISNIMYVSTPDMLLELLKQTNISSFLAGLLARKDHHVLFPTLKIVEILMQKLPGVYLSSFVKEGVIYAIDSLLMLNNLSQHMARQSSNSNNHISISSKCLCFAFTSCPSSTESKACRLGKDVVLTLAKHIKNAYFSNELVNSEMGLTEFLQKLKSYCALLNDNVDKCLTDGVCARAPKEEYMSDILDQVLRELNGGDSMSTFEFIECGIIKSLAHYLSNGRYLQPSFGHQMSLDHSCAVFTRFKMFSGIILSNASQNGQNMLLALLVRKLQDALSCFDNFPIVLSHSTRPRSVIADIPFRHSTLLPCLNVCFVREEGESDLCDFNTVLSIEISSSLKVIEGYLWPKVSGNNNEHQAETAEPAVKVTRHSLNFTSRAFFEGINQEIHASLMEEPSISAISEDLSFEEQQNLLMTTRAKLRELMSERISTPTSADELQIEGSTRSVSSGNEDDHPKLTFALEGKQLDRSMSLYHSIIQNQISVEADLILGPKFWNDVYKVTYKRAEPNMSPAQICTDACDMPRSLFGDKLGFPWHKVSFFSSLLHAELPCKLDKLNPSYDILFMMKILEGLNRFACRLSSMENITLSEGKSNSHDLNIVTSAIPQTEFVSSKLTDKLEQQMRDPLALTPGSMPLWCSELMAACPFLFSLETRLKYFRLTTFGFSKVQLNQSLHSSSTNHVSLNERRSGWSHRKKFKVDRSKILESAAKMMASLAHSKTAVEVEYNEEVGTGLGPTLEFYTLASHEFQKFGMGMWRGDWSSASHPESGIINGESGYVDAPFGLFPRPWSEQTCLSNKVQFFDVTQKFFLLGQLVAKAIKDGRILDMPFSRAFYKVILQQELGLHDIESFDPEFGRTLLEFQALVNRKGCVGGNTEDDSDALCYHNMRIEDLELDFTLPGYSDYVLTSGTYNGVVNIENLEEYVKMAVNATVREGIFRQVESFKSGFNEVFPLKDLQIFTEDELERLLCGEGDTWNFSELLDHIKFDHGYTANSTSSMNLLEIIQEFRCEEKRAFLQFVTGSPRLPPGGLASLNPKMTIVRKHCSNSPDMDLPSVMTCANYLKLPSYSSKERMRQRLLYAITEGQGSFHLS